MFFICFNNLFFQLLCHCCCSVNKSCPTVCNPMDCSTPGFPVLYHLPEFAQTHICWVSNATQPSWVICHPFLLLSSIFPRIRVFSNKSSSRIRWPKYWSFSFNISPFNEYSGLISFRIDWFDLLEVQGTLKSLLQHHNSKASVLWCWRRLLRIPWTSGRPNQSILNEINPEYSLEGLMLKL